MIIKGERAGMEEKAAWIIADAIQMLLEQQERVVLAVPGGRSVSNIFAYLAKEDVEWSKVQVFMVDERLVPLDDPQSNFLLVKEHLAGALPASNVHPFVFDPDAADAGCAAYQAELEKVGGRFDLFLVSSGEDGHIAGLYPQHHSVRDESPFFIAMHDSPKDPPDRMSSSRALLSRSQVGVIVFFGQEKEEALRRFSTDGVDVHECPACLISSLPEFFALTDQLLEEDGDHV